MWISLPTQLSIYALLFCSTTASPCVKGGAVIEVRIVFFSGSFFIKYSTNTLLPSLTIHGHKMPRKQSQDNQYGALSG